MAFAEGYNRALAQVDAEYVVLLNSDVRLLALLNLCWIIGYLFRTVACQPKLLLA